MDSQTARLTVTAAVWTGGSEIDMVELPMPALGEGEALIRITTATVCGSDRHTISGRRESPHPSVLGHEGVGVVVALGAGPAPLRTDGAALDVNDRVVWGVTIACGECDRCRAGATAKCRTVRKVGHESFDSGWSLSGTYASHIVLPKGSTITAVPAELSDAAAAPAGCATATVAAAVERAGLLSGRRVLVIGAGMLGLTAVALTLEAGAAHVTIVDPDLHRRTLATEYGATKSLDITDALPQLDAIFDFSGHAPSVERAVRSLDVGGTVVLVGSVMPGPALCLDPERIVRDWLTVRGVHNYEPRHLQQAVDFLCRTSPRLPWASLVAEVRPLADIGALLQDGDALQPRLAVAANA